MGTHLDPDLNHHEKYAEMCAVFTTGSLTEEELRELKEHLGQCEPCRCLLSEYRQVVRVAIPLAMEDVSQEGSSRLGSWSTEPERGGVVSRVAEHNLVDAGTRFEELSGGGVVGLWRPLRDLDFGRAVVLVVVGALLVGAGYFAGARKEPSFQATPLGQGRFESERTAELDALNKRSLELEAQAKERTANIEGLEEHIRAQTREIARLKKVADEAGSNREAAVSKLDALLDENHALSADREAISKKM